jgi:phenylacetate-CoA ligase
MSIGKRLYRNAPTVMQSALVSLKGAQFRWMRADQKLISQEFEKLLVSQYWSTKEFRVYQHRRLQELLALAFDSVPYYREMRRTLGCHAADIKSVDDIKHLPMLSKQTLRENGLMFLADGRVPRFCNKGYTSGTTGTPLTLYEPRLAFSRRWSFVFRLRRWTGLENVFLPRRAQFTGRDIIPDSAVSRTGKYWRQNYPGNTILFSTTHISAESARAYAEALTQFRPELIDGYPSALLAVVRLAKAQDLRLPRPRAIIVSAETLSDTARQKIEEGFHARVFNQYASSEPSCFWCDCEAGSLHQNPEYGISEILDENGAPVLPGQTGEIVVTSFLNPVMPLIRYRLGDLAVRGPDTLCACGRSMPRVESVVGRADDVLFIPGRGYVGRLDPVFKGVSDIVEAQIVQDSIDTLSVLLVPADGFTESTERLLRDNILKKVGNQVTLTIRKVDRIPRGPNGKFRAVVSKVRNEYPY